MPLYLGTGVRPHLRRKVDAKALLKSNSPLDLARKMKNRTKIAEVHKDTKDERRPENQEYDQCNNLHVSALLFQFS